MPATRLTVALNAKQTTKAPLIVPQSASPDPSAQNSCRALVFKTAQSKLRLKKPLRVFVAGDGTELLNEEGWKNALRDDAVLLVSAGEDYVGVRKDGADRSSSMATEANPDCTVVNLAQKSLIDPSSLAQLRTTATTLPGLVHAVGQPDLHPGSKFPIGAVFVSKGWIHPPLIGGDIGCGMAWYRTTLTRNQVDGVKGKKVADKLRGLEGPWRGPSERVRWLTEASTSGNEEDASKSWTAGEEWDQALGTIGAGNHFAEIQVVEAVDNGFGGAGLHQDEVVLLVHSGSRGYGGDVLRRYTSDSNISLQEHADVTKRYLEEHDRACNWAKANRDLIALRFLSSLEPGEEAWEVGKTNGDCTAAQINTARKKVQERKVVDIWHNNVERTIWPPVKPTTTQITTGTPSSVLSKETRSLSLNEKSTAVSRDDSKNASYAYIHRKGAAPTLYPDTHTPLPLLPLPGSRGTPTLLLHPVFSPSTSYGLANALSLAHGAGRAMSRAKALSSLAQKYKGDGNALLVPAPGKTESLGRPGKTGRDDGDGDWVDGRAVRGGTWVVCEDKELVWEEAPEAYKDVWDVGDDLARAGVAEVKGWCRARVSYKVRR